MPFLTELDERAQVKGSRDPLGLVPIWSKFGREVVGNLTTVTGSVRGFTTLLTGLELADMLREQFRTDAPSPLDTFLRFEQLAGYARYQCHHDKAIRGYRRVSRRLNEGRRIRISADPESQILSNQKTYGLWGLFTVPSRSSGLVRAGELRLTDEARTFVHRHYFPMLPNGRGVKSVLDLLRRPSFDLQPSGRDSALVESLGRMHSRRLRAEERAFYRDHLAWGGANDSTQGRQRALAEILTGIETQEFGFPEFRAVQKKARKNQGLAVALEKIGRLERLIAPAALVFGFLQDRDGQTLVSVAKQIGATWSRPLRLDVSGIRELQPEIGRALQSQAEAELWMELAETLSNARYQRVIELLVAINASVMQRRHGAAAWIAIEGGGKIRVRLADERAELLPVDQADDRWKSTYFINALWNVAREVGV
jgi:hypothetical protein